MIVFLKTLSLYGIIARVLSICIHQSGSELFIIVTNICIPTFIILALYSFLKRKIEGDNPWEIIFGNIWLDFSMPFIDIKLILKGHSRASLIIRAIIFIIWFLFLILGMFKII